MDTRGRTSRAMPPGGSIPWGGSPHGRSLSEDRPAPLQRFQSHVTSQEGRVWGWAVLGVGNDLRVRAGLHGSLEAC